MNYYPFHIGDYAAHTAHLSPIEDIAYRRCIDLYYLHEKALPLDLAEVARLIRMRDHADTVAAVVREFFAQGVDGWYHDRCNDEIERMQDKQIKARASAQASVNARRANAQRPLNERSTDAQQDAQTDVELPTPTPTPTPKDTPPTPRKRVAAANRFDDFWLAWPKGERKQDKAKCLDHWKRNQLDEKAEAILGDVRTKRGTKKWAEGFVEAPLVYLRGKRWLDGVVPEADGGAEPMDWRETAKGIRAKGIEIGVGDWNEHDLSANREHFPAYRARVERRVLELEGGAPDKAGQKRVAELIAGVAR